MNSFVQFCNQVCALAVEAETFPCERDDMFAEVKHVVTYLYKGSEHAALGDDWGDDWVATVVDTSVYSEPVVLYYGRGKTEEDAKTALKEQLLERIDAKRIRAGLGQ